MNEWTSHCERVRLLIGDCRESLKTLPDASVHCCVTSPPYFGLRDYGTDGQIGLEQTPDAYVAELVAVFREVRRVLRDDGTVWLNLGDSYARQAGDDSTKLTDGGMKTGRTGKSDKLFKKGNNTPPSGLKPKDLIGIPWRVAFALQADGWYLRQDIIWKKPNPMPESVKDRCGKSHEYMFLLSKSARYYFDAEAIKEDAANGNENVQCPQGEQTAKRTKRSVWTVATQPYKGAHFATFPPKLIEPCILAGCPKDGTTLDPFNGAGTTALVAIRNNRRYIGCELNPEYATLTRERLAPELAQGRLAI